MVLCVYMRCELVLVVWEPRDVSSGRKSALRRVLLVSQVPEPGYLCRFASAAFHMQAGTRRIPPVVGMVML